MAANADLANLITRLETIVKRLEETGGSGGSGSGDSESVARYVEEFDTFVTDYVEPYLAASAVLGGSVDGQAKCLKSIVDEQRKFLIIASKCSAPKDASVIMKLAAGMSGNMGKMEDFKKKMKNDERSHVSAACEGVVVFSWIGYPKTPMKHVEESKESAKFYTNKVLTSTKNGDKATEHKNWVTSYLNVFDGLHAYIKDHHRTGLSWNAKNLHKPPVAPKPEHLKSDGALSLPPPPPITPPPAENECPTLPPPPPQFLMDPQPGVLDLSRADAAPKALFAEINSKGLGITGGKLTWAWFNNMHGFATYLGLECHNSQHDKLRSSQLHWHKHVDEILQIQPE